MLRIVSVWGTGDTYLAAALYQEFCQQHGRYPNAVTLVIRSDHEAVVKLFPGVRYVCDDLLYCETWGNVDKQENYDNVIVDGTDFYLHPSYVRTRLRSDQLTVGGEQCSQADMYRAMLRLDPATKLALPYHPELRHQRPEVVILPEARSWPNTQPTFWSALLAMLQGAGHETYFNDGGAPLQDLFDRCRAAAWVIGPQCGLLSILVTGRFPCRKILCTPDIGHRGFFYLRETFPYAYVNKFANDDYDVDEFCIRDDNHAALCSAIVEIMDEPRSHDPNPVTSFNMPLSAGEFLDRLAVLKIKMEQLDLPGRVATRREYERYAETYRQAHLPVSVQALYQELVELHRRTFALLSALVPFALAGDTDELAAPHRQAIVYNQERIELKQRIDRQLHSPYTEYKDYFGGLRGGGRSVGRVAPSDGSVGAKDA